MPEQKWNIHFEIYRKKTNQKPHFQLFTLQVDPDENVLDAIERIWAHKDRTLTFRHACHHSTCGVCGMRINGVEKLTCITPIRSVARDGGKIRVEPLRNFPVLSDLVVDISPFFQNMGKAAFSSVVNLDKAGLPYETDMETSADFERLVDCIECGLCVSACPAAMTSSEYIGPAVLAAIQMMSTSNGCGDLLAMADHENGAWRCHSAYDCSEVCPSNVDPAWRIMNLRRKIFTWRIKRSIKTTAQEKKHV